MKTTVVLLVLGLGLAACGGEPTPIADHDIPNDLIGVYVQGSPRAGIKLTLSPDGTYFFHKFTGDITSRGVWESTGDELVLTDAASSEPFYRYRLEGGRLHPMFECPPQAHSILPKPFEREVYPIPDWAKVAPYQIEEAKKHGVPVAFENDLGMRFVLIPAGTFLMGSPEDEEGRSPSETQHKVTLTDPYYMQTTEVTNREYREYVEEPRLVGPNHNGDSQPVVRVTWEEARDFCAKLTAADANRSYRLPTEAEWEGACRAGTTTPYAFGATISVEQANFHFNVGYPLPVGSFACNAWGLCDMHGNVSEWCSDWFERFGPDPVMDPQGPETDEWRVQRGGSYLSRHRAVRSADRDMYQPGDSGKYDIGIRLVSPLPEVAR